MLAVPASRLAQAPALLRVAPRPPPHQSAAGTVGAAQLTQWGTNRHTDASRCLCHRGRGGVG